jgi:hypothetical protein
MGEGVFGVWCFGPREERPPRQPVCAKLPQGVTKKVFSVKF